MLFPYAQLKDSAFLIREGPRARVYRCPALDAGEGDPSVILKEITDEGECGFTDWASLEFLASVPNAVPLVPRFLEGDVDSRAYLVEDLGPSLSLDDALTADDPAAAVQQLTEL
ncbi:MAG: hypothetical protein K0Q72_4747, partial [Armatimonadetes bacterium]|nr:hypothetical protein [Armatimonadota bacterium]